MKKIGQDKNFKQDKNSKIKEREITEELKEAYLDYAMSVIVSRALPDVRDGLKPVHRRILWAMWEDGLVSSAKFKKSANVVGAVLGRYHPHGDQAVYESLVRLAQDFSLRYPLIYGQGNFGSIDGDPAAAQRYTEVKLSKIAEEMLFDIEKETVDWQLNYDASRKEPKVLPAKLPNLLINGASGIAVGMATSIPPHNLSEVVEAINYIIDNPSATTKDLFKFIKGPDFPTGGIIYDLKSIIEVYHNGRGPIKVRAKAEIEENKKGQFSIVIYEIPYQVNKAELISKIALLVQEKKIDGIKDIRDESDREGLRIVIELKNVNPQRILNQLFKYTDLEKDFHLNMVALYDGIQPELMSLKDVLLAYLEHRKQVVYRRTEFDLKRAKERAHILEGLKKALDQIDKIISLIKKSKTTEEAHQKLVKNFKLTNIQAAAILEMKLRTLAALEREKIENELKEKKKLIKELEIILKSPKKILSIIKDELNELKKKYHQERRTRVEEKSLKKVSDEELIPKEESVMIITKRGYVKRVSPDHFRAQKRGGKGIVGEDLREEDFITHFIKVFSHDDVLFFTDKGKVFKIKAYEIPQVSRTHKGKLIQNFLEIPNEEQISALVSFSLKEAKENDLIMVTKNGIIKKTAVEEFLNIRRTGILAINLKKNDELKGVRLASKNDEVIILTKNAQAIRFKVSQVREMSRIASGVLGIRLKKDDEVAWFGLISKGDKEAKILTVTENGFSKQSLIKEYRLQARGGSGIKAQKINQKTGKIVSGRIIKDEEDLLVLSLKGQIIKTKIKDVKKLSRVSAGVKIMKLEKDDRVAGIVVI